MDLGQAVCTSHMELFFKTFRPGVNKTAHHYDIPAETAAKAICQTCPLLVECGELGKTQWEGVYGGMSGWERFKARSTQERRIMTMNKFAAAHGATRWTPEKLAEIKKLKESGLPIVDICERYGISEGAARRAFHRARKAG